MLERTCITVSVGTMGKCFQDSWIEVNGNETEQHGAKSSFLSWGSPLIQRWCQLSCDTNTVGAMFNYHISFQKVLLSLNMAVHIFSVNGPCLTAILNLSKQLGQLILWLPPPQAGPAHAVWRGRGKEASATLGVMHTREARHYMPQQHKESQTAIHPQKKKEICLCQLGFWVENPSVPDRLVSNSCSAHHHGMWLPVTTLPLGNF